MAALVEIKKEPDPLVIGIIRDLLERAMTGDVVAIAAVTVNSDGTTSDVFGGGYPVRLIGGLRIIESEIIDMEVEKRLHTPGMHY